MKITDRKFKFIPKYRSRSSTKHKVASRHMCKAPLDRMDKGQQKTNIMIKHKESETMVFACPCGNLFVVLKWEF